MSAELERPAGRSDLIDGLVLLRLMQGDDRLEPLEAAGEAAVIAAAAVANPLAGVLAAVGFGAKEAITVRRWRRAVDEAVTKTGKLLDPEDPLAVAVFTKLTLSAAQTADEAKLQLLVNALLNSGSDGVDPAYLQEHFADVIGRLSALHVRVLRVIRDHNELGLDLPELHADSLIAALGHDGAGKIDPDLPLIIESVWNELTVDGLVESDSVSSFESSDSPRGRQIHGITPKGERFLKYVANHPNASSAGAPG